MERAKGHRGPGGITWWGQSRALYLPGVYCHARQYTQKIAAPSNEAQAVDRILLVLSVGSDMI